MLNGPNYLLKIPTSVRVKFTAGALRNIEERQVCWRGTMMASPAVRSAAKIKLSRLGKSFEPISLIRRRRGIDSRHFTVADQFHHSYKQKKWAFLWSYWQCWYWHKFPCTRSFSISVVFKFLLVWWACAALCHSCVYTIRNFSHVLSKFFILRLSKYPIAERS